MKYVAFAALALIGVTLIISQEASAQLAGNNAFSLVGNGFAISKDDISDTSIDLLFITNQMKNTIDFSLQTGVLVVGDNDLNISDFSGLLLHNGKIFRTVLSAADSEGNQYTVRILGRIIDTAQTDSIYSLTGTLTDSSKKVTKLVFTTKVSAFTIKTAEETSKSLITIKILKGSATPGERTYIDQKAGYTFKYFSEDRITIPAGGTITFVNEDTASHSLKSGTANYVSRHKTFTPDGKISSGEIQSGKSWSVTFDEPGFYRLFDENYQWMDTTIFVTTKTSSQSLGSNITPRN
jgi:plastocyanin